MDKHTFKVGDRVIIGDETKHVYGISRCGAIGTINEVLGYGFKVALDEPHLNNCDGVWYVSTGDLRHDTDFQVGDWVRYEAVVPYTEGYDTENGKVGQITHLGKEVATIKGELNRKRFISNLVKIQPPQEDKKMDIKRKEDGAIVRDVKEAHKVGYKWIKYSPDCRTEYSEEYWEPVEEWVTIQVEKEGWSRMSRYNNVYDPNGLYGNATAWRYPQ